ncbi:MAG: glycerol-3-phosphate dehydrogenase (NAD(P)+), partial [Myxococcota bacterium]
MSDNRRATVIGGGSWGTALAHLMGVSGADVRIWMRNEERVDELNTKRTNSRYLKDRLIDDHVVATGDLREAAEFAELIIVAIPSSHFRIVANRLGAFVRGDQVLLSATKGFEVEHLTRMSDVLREETCARKVGAISGPNLADEIMNNKPAATVVASRFDEVIDKASTLL